MIPNRILEIARAGGWQGYLLNAMSEIVNTPELNLRYAIDDSLWEAIGKAKEWSTTDRIDHKRRYTELLLNNEHAAAEFWNEV